MKTKIATITFVALLACIAVFAQESTRPASGLVERFNQLDLNKDGKVSQDEWSNPLFRQIDKDGDGFVTLEEAKTFFAGRRNVKPASDAAESQAATSSVPVNSADQLKAVDAVFELCVRDVEACTKFYRDGIGMREIEPADPNKGALLEWAGCYLRLRKVPGDKPAPGKSGDPIQWH